MKYVISLLAYVCGERKGLIQENALHFGETLKKTNYKLDYKVEETLVAKELQELRGREASEETITATLKEFGMKRFLFLMLMILMLVIPKR